MGLYSVLHTVIMQNMLYLGGLGDAPTENFLQIWPTEIEFGSNFE